MHGMRKSQAVHAARHLNVGAHQRDVGSGFQDCDGFVGIQGFNWRVAGVFHHIDRAHAEHHLVLYDENDDWNARKIEHHRMGVHGNGYRLE